MIVRCENCGTEFGFDDRQVGEGITVRCSVCKHVFTVESQRSAGQGWQIRTTDETSFRAPNVQTLREWIDEGRLHPDDQVSRTGRNWVRLGDMPEFADALSRFEGVTPMVSPMREAERAHAVSNQLAAGAAAGLAPGLAPGLAERGLGRPLVAPQSQRPTLSPPRTVPAPTPAPVATRTPAEPAIPPTPARPVLSPPTHAPSELGVVDDDDEDPAFELESEPPSPAAPANPAVGPREALSRQPSPPPAPSPRAPSPSAAPPVKRDGAATAGADGASRPLEDAPSTRQARARTEPRQARARTEPDVATAQLDDFEVETKRRGVGPGLIALLGVVAAVGVAFGVPSIRAKLLSLGQPSATPAGDPAEPIAAAAASPEIAAADRALEKLGIAALAKAEADLQRAIDGGASDPTGTAAHKVALAQLLASRAIAYQIAAALDGTRHAEFQVRATDDQDDAERILDSVEAVANADHLAEVRSLSRLAAGRTQVEVLPMVPAAAVETKLIVEAAVLWRDPAAPVPAGLVTGLSQLPERSGLGESVLALALIRAGDTVEARNVAERLLVGAADQIVALAIRAQVGEAAGETGDTEGDPSVDPNVDPNGDPSGDPNVAKAPPRPGDPSNSSSNSSSGGSSFDRLVERGCEQVSGGDADAGVKTLLRAFDMKPKDLDVLVCLADGYAKQGSNARAVTFYDRALEQSPSNIPALRGAAKVAAKTGATERAKSLYERLLSADPGNATAKAYLAKNTPQDEPAQPETPAPAPAPEPTDTGG